MQQQQQQQQQGPGGVGGDAAPPDAASSPTAASCMPLVELPNAALAALLRVLDARSVLRAGRACTRLHAAATAAMNSITIQHAKQPAVDSLQLYLQRHGDHVTSLDVSAHQPGARCYATPKLLSLPASCSRLNSLSLKEVGVQLEGDGSGAVGVLHAASALTRLSISAGSVLDTAGDVAAAVARLTALQSLQLELWSCLNSAGVLPGSMLAPLTGLTSLTLCSACLDDSTLEHLSSLSGSLQELQLGGGSYEQSLQVPQLTAVQHLSRLTSLLFDNLLGPELGLLHGSAISVPGLSRLTALQRLGFCDCSDMVAHSLAGCRQLLSLTIDQATMADGADGVAALMGHLQACTHTADSPGADGCLRALSQWGRALAVSVCRPDSQQQSEVVDSKRAARAASAADQRLAGDVWRRQAAAAPVGHVAAGGGRRRDAHRRRCWRGGSRHAGAAALLSKAGEALPVCRQPDGRSGGPAGSADPAQLCDPTASRSQLLLIHRPRCLQHGRAERCGAAAGATCLLYRPGIAPAAAAAAAGVEATCRLNTQLARVRWLACSCQGRVSEGCLSGCRSGRITSSSCLVRGAGALS